MLICWGQIMNALNPTLFLTAQSVVVLPLNRRRVSAVQRLYQQVVDRLSQELKGAFAGGQAKLTLGEQQNILAIALPNDWITRPSNRDMFADFGRRIYQLTGIKRIYLTHGGDLWGALMVANGYWVVVSEPELAWMVGA
jgi:hypothetical protein